MSPAPPPAHDVYAGRRDRFAAERDRLDRRSLLLANLRLGLFVGGIAAAIAGLWDLEQIRWAWVALGAGGLAGFAALVRIHGRTKAAFGRARDLAALNAEALSRIARGWDALPPPPGTGEPSATTRDLDLLGRGSLQHLLALPATPFGADTTAAWLTAPADAGEVRARQGAVAELGPLLDLRQELARLGGRVGTGLPDGERFLGWAEGDSWLGRRRWLLWLARGMAAVAVALVAGAVLGVVPVVLASLPVVLNLSLGFVLRRRTEPIFRAISSEGGAFTHLTELLRTASAGPYRDPHLAALGAELRGARDAFARLDRAMSLADVRYSGMVHALLQALLLWDVHVLALLEAWQRSCGGRVRGWLSHLGEIEALCALASLHHDHPDWCFPAIAADGPPRVAARALGHPLLPAEACVRNDVTVGPPGTVLLVTGSNMSGKSTLLRAVGVNAVLALAGGPVCAAELTLPRLTLGTSFRVEDSLEHGVSYFLAELRRLAEVVAQAPPVLGDAPDATGDDHASTPGETPAGAHPPPLLYLFDEILLGTNVIERQVAVQRVLRHLLARHALGAIATHDLTLADADGLAGACQPVHFTESFENRDGERTMTFDYRLRDGIAPTTNALALLEMVGLGE